MEHGFPVPLPSLESPTYSREGRVHYKAPSFSFEHLGSKFTENTIELYIPVSWICQIHVLRLFWRVRISPEFAPRRRMTFALVWRCSTGINSPIVPGAKKLKDSRLEHEVYRCKFYRRVRRCLFSPAILIDWLRGTAIQLLTMMSRRMMVICQIKSGRDHGNITDL